MKLSIAPWGETVGEQIDAARRAEAADMATVWLSELHRSPFVPATAVATQTERIGIGTAVALGFVRSPMATALTALDLDELSAGRFVLGLAAGVQRLNEDWHGVTYDKPVKRLRETIALVRQIVENAHRGEPIEFEGEFVRASIRGWERPFPPARPTIPVYIGAMAPHMLRLAGEVADGWISHELCSPAYLAESALPRLEEGLARSGRDRSSLRIVVSAVCTPDTDGARARRDAAGLVAFYATVRSYQPFFEFHGHGDVPDAVRAHFASGDVEAMRAAIPDSLVDALTLAGRPDEIRERLSAYEGLADEVKLSPPTHYVSAQTTRDAQTRLLELVGAR